MSEFTKTIIVDADPNASPVYHDIASAASDAEIVANELTGREKKRKGKKTEGAREADYVHNFL